MGEFRFNNQFNLKYIIQTSHTSYEPQYIHVPDYKIVEFKIEDVFLKVRDRVLDEVKIVERTPMKMNGDTLEFNAKYFKSVEQDATLESLLKAMPGFSINSNGDIQFNQKSIQVLTIDGKRFFLTSRA